MALYTPVPWFTPPEECVWRGSHLRPLSYLWLTAYRSWTAILHTNPVINSGVVSYSAGSWLTGYIIYTVAGRVGVTVN